MQIKLLKTAILCLLSLASISLAEYVVTTADGNGADGGISNDTNEFANTVGGAGGSAAIRRYDTVRAKAAIVRFDLGSGIGGDAGGAVLEVTETSGTRNRTVNVYGLVDGEGDFWDEATISYDTAPGLLEPYVYNAGEDPNSAIYIDETQWTLIGTMDFLDVRSLGNTAIPCAIPDEFIAADTNGLVTFLIYTANSDNSNSYYINMKESGSDIPNLTFPNARFATAPAPALDEYVLTSHDTLSWTNTAPEAAGPITCDVYLGTNEPNFANPDYDLTKIATGTEDTSLTIPYALSEGKYYWVVDTFDAGTFVGNGAIWYFNVTAAPQVTTGPSDQIAKPGDSAEFSVVIESVSAVTYTWYQSMDNSNDTLADDVVVGGNSDMLTLADIAVSDEGYYYCKAVNSSGEVQAAISDTARLVVQRQVAHWTMDSLVGGVLEDTSGEGNDATPSSEAITFTDGVNVAITSQAAVFDGAIYAQAGTWDPTYVSGEFTLSMWLKLDSSGSSTGILTKHNGWASDTTSWQFGTSSAGQLRIIRAGGTNVYGQSLTVGEWYYVAVTFDGSTATIYSFVPGSDDLTFNTGSGAYSLGPMDDADFNIGCANIDSGTGEPAELFPGVLDEIQVFNYAKTATEIADLYNQAIAQEFCVLEYGSPEFNLDVDDNCIINLIDMASLMNTWLECGLYPNCPQ